MDSSASRAVRAALWDLTAALASASWAWESLRLAWVLCRRLRSRPTSAVRVSVSSHSALRDAGACTPGAAVSGLRVVCLCHWPESVRGEFISLQRCWLGASWHAGSAERQPQGIAALAAPTVSSAEWVEEVTSALLRASSESQLPSSLDAALLVLGPTSSPASTPLQPDAPALHSHKVSGPTACDTHWLNFARWEPYPTRCRQAHV